MTDILDKTIEIIKEKVGGLKSFNFGLPSEEVPVANTQLPGVFVGLRPVTIDFDGNCYVQYTVEVVCRVIILAKDSYELPDELDGYRRLSEILAGSDSRGMLAGNSIAGVIAGNKEALSKAGGDVVAMSVEIDYERRPNQGDVVFSYLKRDNTSKQYNRE